MQEWNESVAIPHININEGPSSPKDTFTDVKATKVSEAKPSHNTNQPEADDNSNLDVEEETSQGSKLFPCPENGCVILDHRHGGRVVNAQEKLYFITQVHIYD